MIDKVPCRGCSAAECDIRGAAWCEKFADWYFRELNDGVRLIDANAFRKMLLNGQEQIRKLHESQNMNVKGETYYSVQSFIDVMDRFPTYNRSDA